MLQTPSAVCNGILSSLFLALAGPTLAADPPPSHTATLCVGGSVVPLTFRDVAGPADAVTVATIGSLSLASPAHSLRVFAVAQDASLDLTKAPSPALEIPFDSEYRVALADLIPALVHANATPSTSDIVLALGTHLLRLRLRDVVGMSACSASPSSSTDFKPTLAVEYVRSLTRDYEEAIKLFKPTDARTELEFSENAIVHIDALTGAVTPQPRVKLRRGHYVIVVVDNGFIVSLRHEQSLAEGGGIYAPKPVPLSDALTSSTDLEAASARLRQAGLIAPEEVLGLNLPVGSLRARVFEWAIAKAKANVQSSATLLELSKALATVAAQQTSGDAGKAARALLALLRDVDDIVSGLAEQARSGWVRAAFRETVYRVVVAPEKTPKSGQVDAASRRDVVLTLNAQKWGSEVAAGFVFAAPGDQTFTYSGEVDGRKTILESTSSAATPFPTLYLNLWMWERPQWGVSLALGVKTDDSRITYGLGVSYLFSRWAQVTAGGLLVPQTTLPSSYYVGQSVPAGDNTLLSLGTESRFRFFIGLGWRFGGSGETKTGAETNPKPSAPSL